jgi:integrase
MPRPRNVVPAYEHHKPSNRAYVRLPDGSGGRRVIYLGMYGTDESKAAYERVLAETRARKAPPDRPVTPAPVTPPAGASVNEVLLAFLGHAARHYRRPDGTTTNELVEFKLVCRALRLACGHAPAADFGPLALKAVRQQLVEAGLSRGVVNSRVNRVRRAFKWAAGEELVPFATFHALTAVAGLQRGRTPAPDHDPVAPADPDAVEATLPFVRPEVAAMARVQLLTGMRPGEVCVMRPADVDRSGPVWHYRPGRHKGAWRGKGRVVAVGPRAQAVLTPFLPDDPDEYVFSPRRAVAALHAERSAKRATPRYASHTARNAAKRAAAPSRPPADHYTADSYGHAVTRGVRRANADRVRGGLPLIAAWRPNQVACCQGVILDAQAGSNGARFLSTP